MPEKLRLEDFHLFFNENYIPRENLKYWPNETGFCIKYNRNGFPTKLYIKNDTWDII